MLCYYIIITVITIILLYVDENYLHNSVIFINSSYQNKHMIGIPSMWNRNPDVDAEWSVCIIAMGLPVWSNWPLILSSWLTWHEVEEVANGWKTQM